MNNYPILTTERLLLKPLVEEDFNDMFAIFSNSDLCASLVGRPVKKTTNAYKNVFNVDLISGNFFTVRLKEEDKFIGYIEADRFFNNKTSLVDYVGLNIVLLSEYQGKGFGTEALKKAVDFVFMGVKAPWIYVNHFPTTPAIAAVLTKCGLTYHATFESKKKPYPQYRYLKEDYIKDNAVNEESAENAYDYCCSPYSYDNPIRKIDDITFTDDVHVSLCGQSVIAMLAKLSVAEVVKTTRNSGESFQWYMENSLRYYGFRYRRRMIKITNDVVLPELCILLMKAPEWSYWSLYHKGTYYDPKFGVFTTPPDDAVFLSCYWEVFSCDNSLI